MKTTPARPQIVKTKTWHEVSGENVKIQGFSKTGENLIFFVCFSTRGYKEVQIIQQKNYL